MDPAWEYEQKPPRAPTAQKPPRAPTAQKPPRAPTAQKPPEPKIESNSGKWFRRIGVLTVVVFVLWILYSVLPAPIGAPGDQGTGYISCSDLGKFYQADHHGAVSWIRVQIAEFECSDDSTQ